ncbi:hypothetical protein FFT09_15955 [Saccharomonospora piscinae]|uniref:type VII secretion target n=1 Tax=Saccharomonospora piscinae TaxID=687388 RepID=UPI0011074128|nr:type VII secretion target [Saccharomonospora piscinae]TLW92494.1 hypothetical protein FFT09_15955 [Saccharomonospora piscinae]
MGKGYAVNAEQLRAHADRIEQIQARFDAVKGASAHIQQDDQAYGLLCAWIAGVLEGRHARQDELIDFVAENLTLAAQALRAAADVYESREREYTELIQSSGALP